MALYEFYDDQMWVTIPMRIMAILLIFIEGMQICIKPKEYLASPFNWLEITGNFLVLLTKIPFFRQFTWIMIFLIYIKAILTLRIFEAQRTLIQMILECLSGMIPFLSIVAFAVFSFALVKYSLDKEEGRETSFLMNLGLQYQIMFGENTELGFKERDIIRWFLYSSFTILMCIVMLNLLISIISDDYDRVQSTQKSTDLRAKCEILKEFGQLEHFFKKYVLRRTMSQGEPMFVHRFIEAS